MPQTTRGPVEGLGRRPEVAGDAASGGGSGRRPEPVTSAAAGEARRGAHESVKCRRGRSRRGGEQQLGICCSRGGGADRFGGRRRRGDEEDAEKRGLGRKDRGSLFFYPNFIVWRAAHGDACGGAGIG